MYSGSHGLKCSGVFEISLQKFRKYKKSNRLLKKRSRRHGNGNGLMGCDGRILKFQIGMIMHGVQTKLININRNTARI